MASVALHTQLYRLRPAPDRLTGFYLAMAVGGALGGVFAALIAPVVFDWTYEYPILIFAAGLLVPQLYLTRAVRSLWTTPRRRLLAYAVVTVLLVVLMLVVVIMCRVQLNICGVRGPRQPMILPAGMVLARCHCRCCSWVEHGVKCIDRNGGVHGRRRRGRDPLHHFSFRSVKCNANPETAKRKEGEGRRGVG